MILINNLTYFENVATNEFILGAASASIVADASAGGANPYTSTDTNLSLRTNKNGVSRLTAIGKALAIGENPVANVSYTLEGFDKVQEKRRSIQNDNFNLQIVKVKAIDLPN